MSQPIQPLGPPPTPPPPVKAKQKRFGWLPLIIASVVALLLGVGIGVGASGAGDAPTTAQPAPTVTATVTETADPPVVEGEPNDGPTDEPTKEPAAWNPKPKDFKVGIKVLKKTCYETLPCDVEFRIVPSYIGSQKFPSDGVTEVTYEVTGGEQDITNTFEVDSEGTVTYDEYESAETARSSTKLVAKVTEVDYNEFG